MAQGGEGRRPSGWFAAPLRVAFALGAAEATGELSARLPGVGLALGLVGAAILGWLHRRGRRLPTGALLGICGALLASAVLPTLALAQDPYGALPAWRAWPLPATSLAFLTSGALAWLAASSRLRELRAPSDGAAKLRIEARPAPRLALGIGLCATAVFLPVSIAGMQISIGVTAAALLLALATGARPALESPLDGPFAALILAATLSWIGLGTLRPLVDHPAAAPFWEVTALWGLISYFVLSRAIRLAHAALLPWCIAAWCTACAAVSALGFAQHWTGFDLVAALGLRPPIRVDAPESPGHFAALGTFSSRLTMAHVTLTVLSLLIGLWLAGALRGRVRLFAALAVALELAGLWATFARAAWLALLAVAALATVLALGVPNRRRALRGLFALGLAALLLSALSPGARSWGAAALRPSRNRDRLFLWARAAEIALDHPIHGVGFGRYAEVLGPYYDRYDQGFFMRTWAHDMPLSLLCETGPLGLFAFFWLFAEGLRLARLAWRAGSSAEASSFARGLCLGAALATLAFFTVSLFHDALYNGEVTYNLAFGLALAACAAARAPAPLPSGRAAINSAPQRC